MQTFINIPTKDLPKAIEFFTALGFTFNAQFTDENATCMILSEQAFVMILKNEYFNTFTKKKIIDATDQVEVMIAISAESREAVDAMADKALEIGGSEANPVQDLGFMYSRSFQDLDHHIWEIAWMDPSALQ